MTLILSDWYRLPEPVKRDILDIEIKQSKNKYADGLYRNFVITGEDDFSVVTNKFRFLKRHLFCVYV